jgi:tRNA modification GTPase
VIDRPTIFALSSGRPPAAIAVVRISGPQSRFAVETIAKKLPEARKATFATLFDPETNEPIDQAVILWFPGPTSETGEDVAELQIHGGTAVIADLLQALGRLEGLRPAEPGEFTRRAFNNGKLDLTAVEGLADLIGAETSAQRRQAVRHLRGVLGQRAEEWRSRLIAAVALVEAGIDFSDEADVPAELMAPALAVARDLADEIAAALAGAGQGEQLRDGMVVAIAGLPNVGKSTLLNLIAGREVAIVSPHAGTTRDVIEVHLNLGGYPVTLLDTAGIRSTGDPVEMEGVRRARARAEAADLMLWMFGARDKGNSGDILVAVPMGRDPETWIVLNKIDLIDSDRERLAKSSEGVEESAVGRRRFAISARTGEGCDGLLAALAEFARTALSGAESALVTRERHRHALRETEEALRRAIAEGPDGREEVVAEELRLAARALGRLTGRVDVEDILDVIFRDFCIGK